MKNSNLLLLSLLGLLLVIISSSYLYYHFTSYTLQEMPISITVKDSKKLGIDVNATALTFGTVSPGIVAERTIVLSATSAEQAFLTVKGIDFVEVAEREVFFNPGETKHIRVRAMPPKETDEGYYEGTLVILTKAI